MNKDINKQLSNENYEVIYISMVSSEAKKTNRPANNIDVFDTEQKAKDELLRRLTSSLKKLEP